mgnify:CR=1 FL=1
MGRGKRGVKKPICIKLNSELVDVVDAISARLGVSRSEVIRLAIYELIKSYYGKLGINVREVELW